MYNILMNNDYIQTLQLFVTSLLREGNESKPLSSLAKYNCSEVSYLLGLKVIDDLGVVAKPFVLKGDVNKGVEHNDNIHDILGFYNQATKKYVIVDPTIWQFYPEETSIFIGEYSSIDSATLNVSKFYEGKWQLSYYIQDIDDNPDKCKEIIRKNCKEA